MTAKTLKTIEQLKKKAQSILDDGTRMPPINSIAAMLDDLGIPYEMRDSSNIVERRTKGCRYVNSRHTGKQGKLMRIVRLMAAHSAWTPLIAITAITVGVMQGSW